MSFLASSLKTSEKNRLFFNPVIESVKDISLSDAASSIFSLLSFNEFMVKRGRRNFI